ncbi:Maf family nucleotide pyrophosphatase [Candidatus Sulfidibacterium hydrothermale]|uniref:Maf family nucleotide pyrophosphatase n=1 Tax=Candidatus Sulfidibacterium hydrothermale TaxID=2875962 RepID=UPI001F0B4747|nr:Maf family nucleotide pyrophosphatase [Candidatus Sulfidibacterium hydrothermale]UBM61486.1 Maf family nucleotide pyrophosphatase [Candidatus Sulfidibacterium hydrothermale]
MLIDKLKDYDVILASGSPRRRQLLSAMQIPFRVVKKEVDEIFPENLSPEEAAAFLCRLKSDAFHDFPWKKNTLVITADTVVAKGDKILGKPSGARQAVEMLRALSDNRHKVITGVCLRTENKISVFTVATAVWFAPLSDDEIDFYIHNFQPFDKAGAYGIQEWIGHVAIQKINGSYFNVMGLPTHELYRRLNEFIA